MPLKRDQKPEVVSQLHEKFSNSAVAILVGFNGLDVAEMTELRQKLREVKGEFRVIKNTMALRAIEGTELADARGAFEGPVAVTFGYGDPVAPAKVLKDFLTCVISTGNRSTIS